jgi:hypothetical protein
MATIQEAQSATDYETVLRHSALKGILALSFALFTLPNHPRLILGFQVGNLITAPLYIAACLGRRQPILINRLLRTAWIGSGVGTLGGALAGWGRLRNADAESVRDRRVRLAYNVSSPLTNPEECTRIDAEFIWGCIAIPANSNPDGRPFNNRYDPRRNTNTRPILETRSSCSFDTRRCGTRLWSRHPYASIPELHGRPGHKARGYERYCGRCHRGSQALRLALHTLSQKNTSSLEHLDLFHPLLYQSSPQLPSSLKINTHSSTRPSSPSNLSLVSPHSFSISLSARSKSAESLACTSVRSARMRACETGPVVVSETMRVRILKRVLWRCETRWE